MDKSIRAGQVKRNQKEAEEWPIGGRPTIEHRAKWGKNWTGGERRAWPRLLIEDEFGEG